MARSRSAGATSEETTTAEVPPTRPPCPTARAARATLRPADRGHVRPEPRTLPTYLKQFDARVLSNADRAHREARQDARVALTPKITAARAIQSKAEVRVRELGGIGWTSLLDTFKGRVSSDPSVSITEVIGRAFRVVTELREMFGRQHFGDLRAALAAAESLGELDSSNAKGTVTVLQKLTEHATNTAGAAESLVRALDRNLAHLETELALVDQDKLPVPPVVEILRLPDVAGTTLPGRSTGTSDFDPRTHGAAPEPDGVRVVKVEGGYRATGGR